MQGLLFLSRRKLSQPSQSGYATKAAAPAKGGKGGKAPPVKEESRRQKKMANYQALRNENLRLIDIRKKKYESYLKKQKDMEYKSQFLKREEVAQNIQAARKEESKTDPQKEALKEDNEWEQWAEDQLEEFHLENSSKLKPEFSFKSKAKAWSLHKTDPHYWTPIRLAHLFDIDVAHMRGILWERKLVDEARAAGDSHDPKELFVVDWETASKKLIRKIETGELVMAFQIGKDPQLVDPKKEDVLFVEDFSVKFLSRLRDLVEVIQRDAFFMKKAANRKPKDSNSGSTQPKKSENENSETSSTSSNAEGDNSVSSKDDFSVDIPDLNSPEIQKMTEEYQWKFFKTYQKDLIPDDWTSVHNMYPPKSTGPSEMPFKTKEELERFEELIGMKSGEMDVVGLVREFGNLDGNPEEAKKLIDEILKKKEETKKKLEDDLENDFDQDFVQSFADLYKAFGVDIKDKIKANEPSKGNLDLENDEEDLLDFRKPSKMTENIYFAPKRHFLTDFVIEGHDIERGLENIFGSSDFKGSFEAIPPKEIHLNKKHNTWYYVPSGVKSQELLKHVRRRYAKHYVESPRIPPRQLDPPRLLNQVVGSGVKAKGKLLPGNKTKWYLVDISECYDLYNRPIIIRDVDNTWHTPNWDERRYVHDFRRYIKRPFRYHDEEMILYPDEELPDHLATAHKAPPSFIPGFNLDDTELTNEDYYEAMGEEFQRRDMIIRRSRGEKVAGDTWLQPGKVINEDGRGNL